MGNPEKFLSRIRNSDQATRYRWVLILTGLSMVLVIGVWIIYLSFILAPESKQTAETSEPSIINSVTANISEATASFGEKTALLWEQIKKQFGTENTVIIEATSTTEH